MKYQAIVAAWPIMALLSTSSVAHAQEGPPDNLAPRQEWHGEVRGGVGHEEVFAIAATGADLAMAVGVTEGRLGMFVDADYLTGQTPMGLHMQTFRLAAAGEYRLGRFHVGAGPELMYFNLKLISQEGGAVTTWGIGVVAFIRFDVVRFANHAVFVDVRAHGDSLDTLRNSTSSWGPAATLGVRL